jgi:hypothetical protein
MVFVVQQGSEVLLAQSDRKVYVVLLEQVQELDVLVIAEEPVQPGLQETLV